MKRFFIFFTIMACVAAAITGYLLLNQVETTREPIDFLGAETPLVIELRDPVTSLLRFKNSYLGKKLAQVDRPLLYQELGIDESTSGRLEKILRILANNLDNPLCRELFGQEVILALVPLEKTNLDTKTGTIADNLVVIVRPRHRAAVLDFVGSLVAGDDQRLVEQFGKTAIREVNLDRSQNGMGSGGIKIYTATANGLLLASMSPTPLRRCLAEVEGESPGLAQQKSYFDLHDRATDTIPMFSYCNLVLFNKLLREKRLNLASSLRRQLEALPVIGNNESWAQAMAITGSTMGNRLTYTATLQYDPAKIAQRNTVFSRHPAANRSLAMVPSNQLLYFWTNYFQLRSWLSPFASERFNLVGRLDKSLHTTTGYGIADLEPLLGRNFALSIADVNADHYVPLPMMCFFLQIKDREQVQRILEKPLSHLPVKRESINSIPITSIQAAGGLLQPSFAYVDDLFIIADSREQLVAILKGDQANTLVHDPLFQRIDNGLAEKNNIVTFIRTRELIGVLQTFASWAGSTLTIEDEQEAARISNLVNRVIMPILEGLKMYRINNGRFYNTGDEFRLVADFLVDADGIQNNIP